MIKNEHNVIFWENGYNSKEVIPICEPTASHDINNKDTPTKNTLDCIVLEDYTAAEINPRECRKLLKKGYTWYLCKKSVTSDKIELDDFLYYHLTVKDERRVRNKDRKIYSYVFKRSQGLTGINERCYVADDRCIILLKFITPSLKLCYLDLLDGKTYFQKVVFFHGSFGLNLANGFLWLVQTPTLLVSEVLHIQPNRAASNCVITKHNIKVPSSVSISLLMKELHFSSNCLLLIKKKKYLLYSPSKHCLLEKSMNIEEVENIKDFFLVGKLFFASRTKEPDNHPIFYIGVLEPEMKITKRIDLSKCLYQYKCYVPYNYEISVHHRGMKALLLSDESYILVLDLLSGKVCQLLSYIPCFWQHKLSIQFSLDGNFIKLIGKFQQMQKPRRTEHLCVNFRTWHGFSLKDFCKRAIVTNFTHEVLMQQNLPRYLMMDLEKCYVYKDETVTS